MDLSTYSPSVFDFFPLKTNIFRYTFLLAKNIRNFKVYCEIIHPFDLLSDDFTTTTLNGKVLFLSGGPRSVYEDTYTSIYPRLRQFILDPNIGVVGVCFGHQLIAHLLGGTVEKGKTSEYGNAVLFTSKEHRQHPLVRGLLGGRLEKVYPVTTNVWMSHTDKITKLPEGFITLGDTTSCTHSIIANDSIKVYGFQFHPEVKHTTEGRYFIFQLLLQIMKVKEDWNERDTLHRCEEYIKSIITSPNQEVVLGLSGGVDSMVTAALLRKVLGYERVHCVLVDHQFLRVNETQQIRDACTSGELNIHLILRSSEKFMELLRGVEEPEQKRKIIGHQFIEEFKEEIKSLSASRPNTQFLLGQGTIYPDIVESAKAKNYSSTKGKDQSQHEPQQHLIKSHHNVGGLPEELGLELVEPLRDLFKDEVRALGKCLGIPESILERHPFPGPGIAIRILGDVTASKAEIVRQADHIFLKLIREEGLYEKISQA